MSQSAPLNTRYSLHLLATKTSDSSPSLLVTFDDARYLFNAPESISRICVQNKVGMKKVGKVFLGELCESSGLPGVIFTAVESGNHKLEVIGPEGLDHLVSSLRYFTRRELLSLKLTKTPAPKSFTSLPTPIHSDPNLIVYAFPLTATPTETSSTLKRKRSSTSPSPSRRSPSPPHAAFTLAPESATYKIIRDAQDIADEATIADEPIKAVVETVDDSAHIFDTSDQNFNPTNFSGRRAEAWREAVLADMFRGRAFLTPQIPALVTASSLPISIPETPVDPLAPAAEVETDVEAAKLAAPRKDTLTLYREGRSAPSPSYFTATLPPPHDNDPYSPKIKIANSYLVQGPPLRGTFLPFEAKKRGVKPGPDFSTLANGGKVWVATSNEPVKEEKKVKLSKKEMMKARAEEEKTRLANKLPDGEGDGVWVLAEECLGKGSEANAFLVLNIPSIDFLPALTSIPTTLFTNLKGAKLQTVIHFLGPSVMSSPAYSYFLNSFPSTVIHRITSPDLPNSDPVTFAPAALLSLRLSKLNEEVFSLPQYTFEEFKSITDPPMAPLFPATFPKDTVRINTNDIIEKAVELAPYAPDIRTFNFPVPSSEADSQAGQLKSSRIKPANQVKVADVYARYLVQVEETKEVVRVESLAREEARKELGEATVVIPGDDLQVTTLGTGSATPSKYRNVSGTLIHLPEGGYILLDAGEGTWGQIARKFGVEGAKEVLRELKLIFISHMHADHHTGLVTIMKMRNSLSPKPKDVLTFVCPPGVRTYLYEQQQLFDLGFGNRAEIKFIDCYALEAQKLNRERIDTWNAVKKLLNLKDLTTVSVLHRCRCWGIVIESETGWKVVFSGDTMPSEPLVVAGQGATLLIHEATMEDELADMARAKGHSTYGQAVDIATRMGARYCLLTHFSARYPKLPSRSRPVLIAPPSPTESTSELIIDVPYEPLVAVAFDLLTLKLSDFWKMDKYRDAMDVLFEDLGLEDESRSIADSSEINGKKLGGNGKDKSRKKEKEEKKVAEEAKETEGKEAGEVQFENAAFAEKSDAMVVD